MWRSCRDVRSRGLADRARNALRCPSACGPRRGPRRTPRPVFHPSPSGPLLQAVPEAIAELTGLLAPSDTRRRPPALGGAGRVGRSRSARNHPARCPGSGGFLAGRRGGEIGAEGGQRWVGVISVPDEAGVFAHEGGQGRGVGDGVEECVGAEVGAGHFDGEIKLGDEVVVVGVGAARRALGRTRCPREGAGRARRRRGRTRRSHRSEWR